MKQLISKRRVLVFDEFMLMMSDDDDNDVSSTRKLKLKFSWASPTA